MDIITQKRLKELLTYDENTGEFFWKIWYRRGSPPGSIAGTKHSEGYTRIHIDGRAYYAHRLAWLYTKGIWPTKQIDHKNEIKTNNVENNLRDVSVSINQHNITAARKDSTLGIRGVRIHNGVISARISINNNRIDLGEFSSVEDAREAYLTAKKKSPSLIAIMPPSYS